MNNIELITKYSAEKFDAVYKMEARCAILDDIASSAIWTSAKTVRIPKIAFSSLKNYTRNNNGDPRVNAGSDGAFGYSAGRASANWEEFTLQWDRGIRYDIEKFDNEESGAILIAKASTEVSRTVVVPEVDAACFSEIASYCSATLGNLVDNTTALSESNIYDALFDGLLYLESHEVPVEQQVIFVSTKVQNLLRKANYDMSRIVMGEWNKDVAYTTFTFEGRPVVVVPPERFKTGWTATDDGYSYATGSQNIDFLMVAKDATMHIKKYEKVKILSGDIVLAGGGFDGYMVFYRIYHGLFVPDNKRVGIYGHYGASTAVTAVLDAIVKNYKITAVTLFPEGQFAALYLSTATEVVGNVPTGTLTMAGVGSDVSAGGDLIAVGANGKIIAKQTLTAKD